MRGLTKTLGRIAAVPAALLAMTGTALASTGGGGSMPWDGPLMTIEEDLTGSVAHVFIIIAIVATGLMWSFGDHGSSMRKVAGIAAGGSLALGATSLISSLGLGTGATIGGAGSTVGMLVPAAALALFTVAAFVAARRAPRSQADLA
jgi:type IV secretion system protein TrbC